MFKQLHVCVVLTGGEALLAGLSLVLPQLQYFTDRASKHFQFLHKIPMFAHYEVQSQIVSWAHKWVPFAHLPLGPCSSFPLCCLPLHLA
jgi:hypothetical protein